MYPYRVTARAVPRVCRQGSCGGPVASRNMFTSPFFPAAHFNPAAEFNGLFRLLDNAAADLFPASQSPRTRHFTPRFDVKEVGSNYELQGELPGIQQKDLQIEFVDDKTLVIRGRSEREYTDSNVNSVDASKAVESGAEGVKTLEASADADDAASQKSGSSANYHKASVEDEYIDAGSEAAESSEKAHAPATENKDVATATTTSQPAESKSAEPSYKYWVNERSIGEFERRFAFPGRVDQDAVTASLKNGILSVVVPKIVGKAARKIEIQ